LTKKNFGQQRFWSKKILVKKDFGQQRFWSKKILVRKDFGKKRFWPNRFWSKNILSRNDFRQKKIFWSTPKNASSCPTRLTPSESANNETKDNNQYRLGRRTVDLVPKKFFYEKYKKMLLPTLETKYSVLGI